MMMHFGFLFMFRILSAAWRDLTHINPLFDLQGRIFIYGGSVMNPTIPADLLELRARFETWRINRKYVREPIPDELWNAAADLSRRHPPSLVGCVLKLDPCRLKKLLIKRSARTTTRKKPQACPSPTPHPNAKFLTKDSRNA
jgi:hypothetical protein